MQYLLQTDFGFDNSWYHAQPHPIIVYYSTTLTNRVYFKNKIGFSFGATTVTRLYFNANLNR